MFEGKTGTWVVCLRLIITVIALSLFSLARVCIHTFGGAKSIRAEVCVWAGKSFLWQLMGMTTGPMMHLRSELTLLHTTDTFGVFLCVFRHSDLENFTLCGHKLHI